MLTTFIGATRAEIDAFVEAERCEINQLNELADRYDRRIERRNRRIKALRAELNHLQEKKSRELKICRELTDRIIARNKHITALCDELFAAKAAQEASA